MNPKDCGWAARHERGRSVSSVIGTRSTRFKVCCILPRMEFDWDDEKVAINLADHKVSFDEAKTVFDDPLYVDFYDPDHSYDEHRYLILASRSKGVC